MVGGIVLKKKKKCAVCAVCAVCALRCVGSLLTPSPAVCAVCPLRCVGSPPLRPRYSTISQLPHGAVAYATMYRFGLTLNLTTGRRSLAVGVRSLFGH